MSVDIVGVTLILTFVVMVATAAIALLSQRPPVYRQNLVCPEDRSQARVSVSWDRSQCRMLVTECDHGQWSEGQCHKGCEASLPKAFPDLTPVTVLP